ncbi:MAG: galactokinase family protein [Vicinamibacterales bacterium]
MSADRWEARCRTAGFGEADARSRAALVGQAAAAFTASTGREPHWAWFVPGRIEIVGKHTDYAGGRSLVAAVPRGFAVVAGPRTDDVVAVTDARWRDAVQVDLRGPARRYKGWANYVGVVAGRLALNFPGAVLGADIAVASDLPRAAGLSSSSAFVVGLSLALIRRARLEARDDWRRAIGSPLDLAGYLGAVENGLTFGPLANASGVGTHGGSEDHTAILTSTADRVAAFAYVPVRHAGDAAMPDDWRFSVLTSGVHADKAGSVRGQYNRASLATRALAALWTAHTGEAVTLGAALQVPGAEPVLRSLLAPAGCEDFSAAELDRRLTHFIHEDGRVPRMLDAFRAADTAALGRLAESSQTEAEQLLANQVPETIRLAALAREAGAFSASSFGAGFGGSVWALMPAADAAAITADWRARFEAEFPASRPVDGFITRPGPRAVDLSDDATTAVQG